ncbi:MAG: CaiB/BaiF CoA-transferase family protein [Ottowia sp.]|uniref:CaiB/BaiF CoA transferase family protein n=1 Tax=Ottowia sp. TaxID=1898956 RepID=UPI003C7351C6
MQKALSHLRVLDLTRVLAGPWSTQNLADMGAEVIKIERPGLGDDTRAWGPPFLRDAEGRETFDSSYFLSANRGKKSITLDISTPEGQRIVRELARHCDVLVENYKVGNLARYGLAYEDIAKINPRLVYCSITGFGQTGPYAPLPGYDFVFQGMGGLMSLTGRADDEPGAGPLKVGIAIGDILAGMYATSAILAALEHRHTSGKGQYIDISLLDSVVALNSYQALNYLIAGKMPRRLGNSHPNIVPYQVFHCKEGDVIVAVGNNSQYRSFCEALERPDLAVDPRFELGEQRILNREQLVPQISAIMLTRTMMEWVERLEKFNVPCGPIYTMDQVFEDPQIRHREMRVDVPHAAGVLAPGLANPMRFSDTPITYECAAPTLGQHTDEVLAEMLKHSPEEIAALRERKIV